MTLLFRSYDSGPFFLSSPWGDTLLPSRPPKSLPGDLYKEGKDGTDGTVVRSIHRGLVGIVDFKSRVSMGRSNNGVPLYLFYPFDAGYPPFIVGSKARPAENLICTVDFVDWVTEWPRGAIQERLGSVGEAAVERAACIRSATVGKLTDEGILAPDLSEYRNEDWDAVFNIDPEGCEDVDDVLAYKVTPTGTTWLIGIADVAAFVQEGSPMDLVAAKRGQTLYEDGTVVAPMLPNIISTGLASLRRDGVRRPVLGLRLRVSGGVATVEGLGFYQVAVTKAFTYESVLADAEVCGHVEALSLALSGSLSGALSGPSLGPHEWVATTMVAYNAHVAQRLRAASTGLLRRQPASDAPLYAEIAATSGCPEIAHLGAAAGEYCSSSTGDVSHTGLGLSEYCHASSPLRRYADLVNQRCLHALLRGKVAAVPPAVAALASAEALVSAEALNHRAFVARRMERDLWFLKHAPTGMISSTDGILLHAKSELSACVSVYCPGWKRVMTATTTDAPTVPVVPGSTVAIRVFVDPSSPRRRIICQATAIASVASIASIASNAAAAADPT